jgi:hypothetical protein
MLLIFVRGVLLYLLEIVTGQKSFILLLYLLAYITTHVFPLSAFAIISSSFTSLLFILFLLSMCVVFL